MAVRTLLDRGTVLTSSCREVFKAILCCGTTSLYRADRQHQCRHRLLSTVSCETPEHVAEFMMSKPTERVVVMAGAGISTASGIPDFRSPGTGLYDNLQKYDLPYAEAVFDIGYFQNNPQPFFTLARELYPTPKIRPNVAHYFVKLLHQQDMLLRMYTQNIDSLERMAGIPSELLVEAHGSFAKATCRVCRKKYEGVEIKESIFKGEVPTCIEKDCKGVIKPDIVFFGEQLPMNFWNFETDLPEADLLIILGTSLEVEPFASIASCVSPGVPRILFNLQATGPFAYRRRNNDVVFEGDLAENIWKFSEFLGWKDRLKKLINTSEEKFKKNLAEE